MNPEEINPYCNAICLMAIILGEPVPTGRSRRDGIWDPEPKLGSNCLLKVSWDSVPESYSVFTSEDALYCALSSVSLASLTRQEDYLY